MPARRSSCAVACALDLFGDRWTLLVIRDLLLGGSRFKDFATAPERIPTNILSDRLRRLVEEGVIEKVPAVAGSKRLAYRLTATCEALRPVLAAIRDWALVWETVAPPIEADETPDRVKSLHQPEPEEHFADLG